MKKIGKSKKNVRDGQQLRTCDEDEEQYQIESWKPESFILPVSLLLLLLLLLPTLQQRLQLKSISAHRIAVILLVLGLISATQHPPPANCLLETQHGFLCGPFSVNLPEEASAQCRADRMRNNQGHQLQKTSQAKQVASSATANQSKAGESSPENESMIWEGKNGWHWNCEPCICRFRGPLGDIDGFPALRTWLASKPALLLQLN